MKRTLFYLLLVVMFAGWIGTLIARDAGYVLVAYDGMTVQTSLWVMIGLLMALTSLLFYALRSLHFVSGVTKQFKYRGEKKQLTKSNLQTTKGLLFYQEGKYDRAEKYLISGVTNSGDPAYNYIAAAKAANMMGKGELRESYLRKAQTESKSSGKNISVVIAIAAAEMALFRKDWRVSVEHLAAVKDNELTIRIKRDALMGSQDWLALTNLMPDIRKYLGHDSCDKFEVDSLRKCIENTAVDDETKLEVYKRSTPSIQSNFTVIHSLVKAIGESTKNEKSLEDIIRKAIKVCWQSELLMLYGELGKETLKQRLKCAQGWQKTHKDDAGLTYCLGCLYDLNGDREKAKLNYEISFGLEKHNATARRIAKLLAFEGDAEKSNEYLLMLSE